MKIITDFPQGFSDLGKRDIQQDAIYPSIPDLNQDSNIFVVCDGMGGHVSGEIASNVVANSILQNCAVFQKGGCSVQSFNQLLETVWCELDKYYDEDYGDRQMGTTLAFLCFTERGYFAAHIGDSRIYHIRPSAISNIIYKSADHSQVAELVAEGVITQLESLSYNNKNLLNKAMIPLTRYEADIFEGTDVQGGDYFMLCTDGVLENLTDEMIKFIFSTYRTADEIVNLIHLHCMELSKDNNTCIVIPIADVRENSFEVTKTDICTDEKTVWKDDELLRDTINQIYEKV